MVLISSRHSGFHNETRMLNASGEEKQLALAGRLFGFHTTSYLIIIFT